MGSLHDKKTQRAQETSFLKEEAFSSYGGCRRGEYDKKTTPTTTKTNLPSSLSVLFFPGTLPDCFESPETDARERMRMFKESNSLGFESQLCHVRPSSCCQSLVWPSSNRKAIHYNMFCSSVPAIKDITTMYWVFVFKKKWKQVFAILDRQRWGSCTPLRLELSDTHLHPPPVKLSQSFERKAKAEGSLIEWEDSVYSSAKWG